MKDINKEDLDLIKGGHLTYYTWKIAFIERYSYHLKTYKERYDICVKLGKSQDVLDCIQKMIDKISELRDSVVQSVTAEINEDLATLSNQIFANERAILSQARELLPSMGNGSSFTIQDVLNSEETKLIQSRSFGLKNVAYRNFLNSIEYKSNLESDYEKLIGLKTLVSSIYMTVTPGGTVRNEHYCLNDSVFYCSRDYIKSLCKKIETLAKQKHKEADKSNTRIRILTNKKQLTDQDLFLNQQIIDADRDFQDLFFASLYFSERFNKKRIKEADKDVHHIEENSSPSVYAYSPDEAKYHKSEELDMCFDKAHLFEFIKYAKLQPETIEEAITFASIANVDLQYTKGNFARVQKLLPQVNNILNTLANELEFYKLSEEAFSGQQKIETKLNQIYDKLRVIANMRFDSPLGELRLKKNKVVDSNNKEYSIAEITNYTPPLVFIDPSEYDDIPDDEPKQ